MITADYHVHSDFSADSDAPMREMIECAIDLGLKRLCFTDHMDFEFPKEYKLCFEFNVDSYFDAISKLQETYKNQITILKGIELGLKPNLSQPLEKLLTDYPFDFVIGSSHLVENKDPYFPAFWEKQSVQAGIEKYFQSIIQNMEEFTNFDVYGHIDYIVRYIPRELFSPECNSNNFYDMFHELLDLVLLSLIKAGKAIEINTAGYKYGLSHPNPTEAIIKRYFQLGGSYITIGSDAHSPQHLAYDFHRVETVLKELGVTQYAVFEDRNPILLNF